MSGFATLILIHGAAVVRVRPAVERVYGRTRPIKSNYPRQVAPPRTMPWPSVAPRRVGSRRVACDVGPVERWRRRGP